MPKQSTPQRRPHSRRPAARKSGHDLEILRLIDEGTAAKTGTAFFRELVQRLAEALDSKYAFISRFCDENTRVHVLAMWNGEAIVENFDYKLAGSPCEQVLNGDIVGYDSNVVALFPAEKEDLEAMNAEAYLAIPLRNLEGTVLGHLAVIATEEKKWQERDHGILRIFAARATAEIERQLADEELLAANAALARRVTLETLVASISSRFVGAPSDAIDVEIQHALALIGRFIGADRGLLFRLSADKAVATLTNEWVDDPTLSVITNRPVMLREESPDLFALMLNDQTINVSRQEDMPPGFDVIHARLRTDAVISRVAVPVRYRNETIGVLGFHAVRTPRLWPETDVRLIRLLAEIVASALARQETEVALHAAREVAESASRAKSEFLASMTHELRTPLNGVLGYAQLLKRDPTLSDSQLESVESLERCGEHLLTLISDVLDLAKIEAGRLDIDVVRFGLDDFLRDVADIARLRATQAGLAFSHDTRTRLPAVITGDQRKLRQVLLNLLGNAVKFTEHGSVRFSVGSQSRPDGTVTLTFTIEDTGQGIPPAEVEQIFSPFYQVKNNSRQIEGTGLGLAITRKLIDLLNGTLTLTSEVGKGSTFTVTIDAEESGLPVQANGRSRRAQPTGYAGPRKRILIADDKADNRQVLGRFLQSLGFLVGEAEDGKEAVEMTHLLRPDLIFMDLVMPVKDGFEAIREIRRAAAVGGTPIIAISASTFDTTRLQSEQAGCDDFITKPVQLEHVLDILNQRLAIEWTYRVEPRIMTDAAVPDAAFDGLKHLPADTLRQIYELSLMGDVQTLRERIADIGRHDSACGPALQQLDTLLASYDMKRLRTLLRPMLEVRAS